MKRKNTLSFQKLSQSGLIKTSLSIILTLMLFLLLQDPAVQSFSKEVLGVNSDWILFQPSTNGGVESAFVKRIIDGDTIELTDGRKIRYLNIDTPETVKPNTPVECFGLEAKTLNSELIGDKQIWMTQDKDPTDIYNRELRFIFIAEDQTNDVTQSINALMVREGYATTSFYSPNTTFKFEFEQLEQEAKQNQRGLWSACKKSNK